MKFLLVKSFKLVPRLLYECPEPRQIKLWFGLHGIILEGKPIGLDQKKNSLNKSSQFGCLFFHFILLFFILFFYLRCSNENGRHIYGLRTLLKAQQLPHFLINFRINMIGFVDPCKVIARKSAFSALPIQVHKMEMKTVN
jgi:hypothetical protein